MQFGFPATPAKSALQAVMKSACEEGGRQLRLRFRAWAAEDKMRRLYEHIRDIRKVKTIWQLDKPVDLKDFYYPTCIFMHGSRKKIDTVLDLGVDQQCILFEGIAGQGKSIFFRYLASREMYRGECIPVFVELRRLGATERVIDAVVCMFHDLGFKCDEATVLFLANRGKIILFLDGFDELGRADRLRVLRECETLAVRYRALRILLTARPGTEAATSVQFIRNEICSLTEGDVPRVIERLANSREESESVCQQLRETDTGVLSMLRTPLLVALLMFRFRVDQTIPDNLDAFYSSLFEVLLSRHDRLKPGGGYYRPRASKLSDQKILRVFNAFCFVSRIEKVGVFRQQELVAIAERAMARAAISARADAFVDDIVHITCLVLKEGDRYKFIHKSVQEYHAACYISELDETRATYFYTSMHERWTQWRQELEFLRVRDTYRFFRWFGLPEIKRMLGIPLRDSIPEQIEISADALAATLHGGRIQNDPQSGEAVMLATFRAYFFPEQPLVRRLAMSWDEVVSRAPELVERAWSEDGSKVLMQWIPLERIWSSNIEYDIAREICSDRVLEFYNHMLGVGMRAEAMIRECENAAREDKGWFTEDHQSPGGLARRMGALDEDGLE